VTLSVTSGNVEFSGNTVGSLKY